jgi:predicted nicotinamide N-methyase
VTGQSARRETVVTDPSAAEIVRGCTRLHPVSLVPEIQLYQAAEPVSAWQHTEQVTGRTGLDPPFWAFAWAGGQALARYLLDHPETVTARHVIDIASGSGLVAIAAAMAGAATVTAYDIDPLAAAAITLNAQANDVAIRPVCADVLSGAPQPLASTRPMDAPQPLASTRPMDAPQPPASTRPPAGALPPDSADPPSDGALSPDRADPPSDGALQSDGSQLVLIADAFYERDLATHALRFAERARARGAAVLLGDLGRAYLPRARLTPLATYDVPGLAALEDRDTKRTTIWALP